MSRILFLLLVLTTSIAFSQTQQKQAYIFAELGRANDKKVVEQFSKFDQLLNEQFNSQGFIINYGTDKELAKREKQIRNSIRFRKYDATRITLVRGGNLAKFKSVFWIVPAGAETPTP